MGEPYSASITIGGRLKKSYVDELAEVLNGAGLKTDGDGPEIDEVATAEEILALRDARGFLHFADYERNWGDFSSLESFCEKRRLPFDYECDSSSNGEGGSRFVAIRWVDGKKVIAHRHRDGGEDSVTIEEGVVFEWIEYLRKGKVKDVVTSMLKECSPIQVMDIFEIV